MAHPELELISNVIESGDFVTLKKKGVTRDIFSLDSAKEVFVWLWDEFHNPTQKGEVPTESRLKRRFPDFDFSPTRNSLAALVTDIKRQSTQIKLTALIEDINDEILDDSDPTLVLESFLPRLRELNVEAASQEGIRLSEAAEMIRQDYYTKKKAGGVTGIPYPWELMNSPTGGMQDEQFIVIYGRPGNMKTWLACVMAAWAWQSNRRVMFFSKEISRTDIIKRISSVLAGVDYAKLRAGNLPVDDEDAFFELLDAIEEIEESETVGGHRRSLYCISDKGKRTTSTVDDLIAQAEVFQPDVVFVDGFYLMRDGRSGSRTADWKQIAHISQDLKGMAQYLECPVIGTTQANRANAKQPSGDLDDLSFADAIGMDADIAMRAFRGPNPKGRGASIMLVFSKVREAVIRPFVINACPGDDFSVLEKTVNIKQFLETKQKMDTQENQAASTGGGPATKPKKPGPKKTGRKRNDPFRD
jgi:replicative DNA helicase